ncbi:response regulator [Thalassomonas actiniarum]|uniref:Response regulator n=1 Tax=Thalassomonas actiniarum TaxID=485447 RepID=A0AAE9YQZ5_9GAMM|nr:response regulator [Thalassomonas actiniarum]WDD99649.1 response regulator [Thalassomonas actiniarum]
MRNINFLVVDDCPTVRKIMHKALRHKLGAEKIFDACDGKDAINVLATEKIDIIISDWEMPKMNGEELLLKIRKTPKFQDMPFIMMTTHGERSFVLRAIQNGANHYLTKPFSSEKLEEAIRKSWHGSDRRECARHACLPMHKLILNSDQGALAAEALNISQTGILIRLPYNDNIRLFGEFTLKIEFEDVELLDVEFKSLIGRVVRINEADSYDNHELACEVGLNFNFEKTNKAGSEQLNNLLKYLSTFGQEVIASAS